MATTQGGDVLRAPTQAQGSTAQSLVVFPPRFHMALSLDGDTAVAGLCGRHAHISYLAWIAGIKMHFGSPRTIKKKKEALSH